MKSKLFFVSLFVIALALAGPTAYAQNAIFKKDADHTMVAGSLVKVGAGGVADNAITGTATPTAAAATLSTDSGTITTEALTTAGLAEYSLVLTDTKITAASKVFVNAYNGTNTQGTIAGGRAIPASGSATIKVPNLHATQALNGTIKIQFFVVQ